MSSTMFDTSAFSSITSAVTTVLPAMNGNWQASVLWMLVVGFIIAFILAFAVGANDVANSFGTTVGAGTLTLKQACILASIFETLGAILLGAKVGHTIRKGIIDVTIYDDSASLLMVGEISAMLASGLWQLIATFLKLPVSGTHSIVGATVGFSLVARGATGVQWSKIGLIVGSWFLSPVLAGLMAAGCYYLLRVLIFQKDNPAVPGLIALPIMYGVTVAINCFSVLYAGAPLLGLDKLPHWADVVIALVAGVIIASLVQLVVVRKMKESFRDILNKNLITSSVAQTNFGGKKVGKLPPLMETISEKESLDGSLKINGSTELVDGVKAESDVSKLEKMGSNGSIHSKDETKSLLVPDCAGDAPGQQTRIPSLRHSVTSSRTMEEAKLLRQQTSKRSRSTGQVSSSVRIPLVLQLEKEVVKTTLPVPTVQEIKDEIRRNFSEPAMAGLTQHHDADVYEVYINRPRRLVTIQRRNNSSGDATGKSQNDPRAQEPELERLLSSIVSGPEMKLEEPFDESDEEGGLMMSAPVGAEHVVPAIYSGAIEEGFRRLSTSQQNTIAIKIGDDDNSLKKEKLSKEEILEAKEGRLEIRKMFSFLQILTACFGSFAHGGNDVSNAIGPLIAVWIIYQEGGVQQESSTPLWILLYGGVGICVGLWVWGRRVIETMGNDLTNLTPSRGFTIELMSAITVLIASTVGLPVSTTHCKVGAVVSVGWVRARDAVDWKIFRNIVLAWFVTVPISGGLSAVIFAAIRAIAGLS